MPGFQDIIGQEHIKKHLKRALTKGRVSHAYLFSGEAHAGKEFIARVFTQALLCEDLSPEGEPCGICSACKRVMSTAHPDMRIIAHEKENIIRVDEITAQLVDDAYLMPYEAQRKVYIVPDADKMNDAAQNKLLKTLEEPPAYAVILLLATGPDALLDTIRSRSVPLMLHPAPAEELHRFLVKSGAEPSHARMASAFARGNTGLALMLSTDDAYIERRRAILRLLQDLEKLDFHGIQTQLHTLFQGEQGEARAREELFSLTRCFLRDICVCRATGRADDLLLSDLKEYISDIAPRLSYRALFRTERALRQAKAQIEANVNAANAAELFLLKLRGIFLEQEEAPRF